MLTNNKPAGKAEGSINNLEDFNAIFKVTRGPVPHAVNLFPSTEQENTELCERAREIILHRLCE